MRRIRVRLSSAQRADLWWRWKAGQSLHEIGRAFGESHVVIHFLLARSWRGGSVFLNHDFGGFDDYHDFIALFQVQLFGALLRDHTLNDVLTDLHGYMSHYVAEHNVRNGATQLIPRRDCHRLSPCASQQKSILCGPVKTYRPLEGYAGHTFRSQNFPSCRRHLIYFCCPLVYIVVVATRMEAFVEILMGDHVSLPRGIDQLNERQQPCYNTIVYD
jgi:hypothetical protein